MPPSLAQLATFLLLALTSIAHARPLCVFDMAGAQGPLTTAMKEFALYSKSKGQPLEVRTYVDERVATEDFKAGQCDAVLLTGVRARPFNSFTGSIDSVGGLPDYGMLQRLLDTLARPDAAALMRQGDYEIGGILPLGAAYLFLRDRRIDSVAKMAGRRLAVLEHDAAQLRMAERIGAQAVSADVTTFAGKFNNGAVDVIAAPGIAYMPLELYKGVGTQGVVVKLPVAQLTLQLVMRRAAFPEDFGQQARGWFAGRSEDALRLIRQAEDDILFFFPVPDGEEGQYREMMREARISLTTEGIYDARMMRLMKKVRCRALPDAAECSDNRE